MKTQKNYLILSLIFLGTFLQAQITVSGKVAYKNKGVKDVSITLKDTYDGATTDAEGNYTFKTTETGNKKLVFSNNNFNEVEKDIFIDGKDITINVDLKEKISEINAVTITAGSIEASDKKRATTLLTPIDIYTTAGANAELTKAIGFLPGVQKVGESEGLFVRGGTAGESKIFMDGSLINNYFTNTVPGIAGRDRFNTSLFKGNVFSSGGYSALYGQALSSVLILESIDMPEKTSIDVGVSPIFVSGNYQNVNAAKTRSFGIAGGYSNLGLMTKIFKFNSNFTPAPESFNTDANFRVKTKGGGIIKYYGSFDTNTLGILTPSLEQYTDQNQIHLKGKNTYQNLSYRQKFGKYILNLGSSYTYNDNLINLDYLANGQTLANTQINKSGNYFNLKGTLETKINKISAVRGGIEIQNTNDLIKVNSISYPTLKNTNTALFAETDLGFNNNLSAKIGTRAEYSNYLQKWNIAPRLALAYRISKEWTSSLAYGIFYQNTESQYLNPNYLGNFQRADHYIFQLQRSAEGRSLRLEAFYKNYDQLVKTQALSGDVPQNFARQTMVSNDGSGYAKGFELFWRDKKTLKSIDYWISYSYLDSKRDFLNYPTSLFPNFASKNTLNVVMKKFVTNWKTGFNLSYTYNTGRPYYNITNQNGQNVMTSQGKVKDYSSLNFSLNYLPNLGKKDARAFTVFVLQVSNVLGTKNIYGYNFSQDGLRSSPIVPPVNTFVFVGAFISFGVDKTQDAINNNL